MREAQDRFLEALPRVGLSGEPGEPANISMACRVAGVGRETHYGWLKHDPTYRPRFEEAMDLARGMLRSELHRRGYLGWEEPWKVIEHRRVDSDGNVTVEHEVLNRRKFSDRIALRVAEAHLPEFRRRVDLHVIEEKAKELTDDELDRRIEELRRKMVKRVV
jgi:hypothetical protein